MQPGSPARHAPASDLATPWTVWLPLVPVTLLFVLMAAWRPGFDLLTYKEGPVEWATVAVALLGAAAAVVAFLRRNRLPDRRLGWLMLVFAAGMIFIAGEESSWGQHILNPRLPGDPEEVKTGGLPNVDPRSQGALTGEEREAVLQELSWFQRLNDQSETNLHNLPGFWGDLFGKLPKQLIEYGSLVACVILPLFFAQKLNLHDRSRLAHWLMPTTATTLAALVAFLLPWPRRIVKLFIEEEPIVLRLSEPQEFYLVLTLALYAASLAVRLKSQREADTTAAEAPASARAASGG